MPTPPKPPVARIENVRDDYFGTVVNDPYRWMEDYRSDEMRQYIEGQAAYARAYLEGLPARDTFLERVRAFSGSRPQISHPQIEGERIFYQRRDPDERLPKLCVRHGLDGTEVVLLDPNTIDGEVHTSIDWFQASPTGAQVAVGLSQGGSEESVAHVIDVASGVMTNLNLTRVLFGMVDWVDDETFVYNRLPEMTPDVPPTDYYSNSRVFVHRLGAVPETDPVILGRGRNPEVEFAPIDIPQVFTARDSDWALGTVMHGDANELSIYAAPRAALDDPDNMRWVSVAEPEDAVVRAVLYKDEVLLLTHRDAPRYQVLATRLDAPDFANARVVVPESEGVIRAIKAVGDRLLVLEMVRGNDRLRLVDLATGESRDVPLPYPGGLGAWASDKDGQNAVIDLMSWVHPAEFFHLDLNSGVSRRLDWLPPSEIDTSALELTEVMVPSHDGVEVPMTIVHKKGLALDGQNPALLMGYGSYGIVIPPHLQPQMMAWYERGGVYAVARIRGGGDLGKEWHEAGRFLKKTNTILDFIACGEYLVDKGYTNPARLAGEGTSAGGIPSSGSLVRRPDLWAAMIIRVGVTNALRMEYTENGPPNVMEFGTGTDPDGFRGLLEMDGYHKVEDGVEYPAVMLTTGLNDPRVVVWMTTKMTARLQAATASDHPVLMRVEAQAGHGMGSNLDQVNNELADKFAFLWAQFGMPEA